MPSSCVPARIFWLREGAGVPGPRPSGPPSATRRRTIVGAGVSPAHQSRSGWDRVSERLWDVAGGVPRYLASRGPGLLIRLRRPSVADQRGRAGVELEGLRPR